MATHELLASVRKRGGIPVVDLIGDLDAAADAVLDRAYDQATRSAAGTVVLNFSGTDYINSTGIALIVALLARARDDGMEVRAFGLSDHYRKIFEITRLSDFMAITDDEDGAMSRDA